MVHVCGLWMWLVDVCGHEIHVGFVCGLVNEIYFNVSGLGMWLTVVFSCCHEAVAILMGVCWVSGLVGAVVIGCELAWGLEKGVFVV